MDMAKILSVSFCCGRAIFDCGFSAELIFGVYRRIDQLDDSVEHEHDARNGDHDTEQFTEGEHETDDDRERSKNDIYDILFGSAKLADQSDDTLESDENTENPRVVTVEDEDIMLTAIFQKVGTDVENVGIEGVTIYSDGTVLHVEGAEKEYQIYSTTGSLLYRGTDAEVALPRGIYVVRYGNAIEKVVL